MKKNIGLLIHGPIIFKDYDCNQSLIQQIDLFKSLFNEIVLVTWENQKENIKNELLKKNIKIKFIKDPGQPVLYNGNIPYGDNEFRSFLPCYKAIKTMNSEYIFKIRSDLKIDMEKSLNHFFRETKRKNDEIICASSFRLSLPFALGDFIYIGRKDIIKKFFYCQMKYKRLRFNIFDKGSPEAEVIKRYIFSKRKSLNQFSNLDFFPMIKKNIINESSFINKRTLDLWQICMNDYFSILNDQIREKMTLRGKIINDPKGIGRIDSNYETWLKCEKNLIWTIKEYIKKNNSWSNILNLPSYLSISYFRISEFKNRNKSNILLYFQRTIYIFLNNVINFINKLYKKIKWKK